MDQTSEENIESFTNIKVFSSDDEKLKVVGELLSNKSSRDIIKLLIEREMYTNEIAKKLDLRVSLVIHHLQKMKSIGLLEITSKKITRKGEEHSFFRIPNGMLIVPNESKEIKKNGTLKKIFRERIKFVCIGVTGVLSWFIFDLFSFDKNEWSNAYQQQDGFLLATVVGLMAVIVGLSVCIGFKNKRG